MLDAERAARAGHAARRTGRSRSASPDCRTALPHSSTEARVGGKTVAALGASTKGNVLLQYCGITEQDMQRSAR